MNSVGRTIQYLRRAKGVTQEKMAQQIGVSFQAISKWENEYTLPDIMLLPVIAEYFGVSIDDLFQYKWNAMTNKERLACFMLKNGIMRLSKDQRSYEIDTERFATGMQLNAVGESFAEFLIEQRIEFDAIMGIAYNGIGFAAATAVALQSHYGVTTQFCCERLTEDRRGRILCGYAPCDGDRIVVIDDMIGTRCSLNERIDRLLEYADVEIAAILVIAETSTDAAAKTQLELKYRTKVHGMTTDRDIRAALCGAGVRL